ncbi:hypothetical protein FSP39_020981 [Pinctada imbricata]|uniref:Heme-binding protein 2 n=1 Tax=Pinctada imbricata TaxID=66713 RepID=A0AA89C2L5_PINIB|nr:hypothetical protein FSP39_020981 [Pinctada imbricata]
MRSLYIVLLCLPFLSHGSVLKFKPKQVVNVIDQLAGKASSLGKWHPPSFCNNIDCPEYKVMEKHKDYELREYVSTRWVSTNIAGVDYTEASTQDFHRLFSYISGNNAKKEKIAMTAPVLIQVIPGQGPACESNFTMSFFVSPKESNPPKPSDPKVWIKKEEKTRVYVRYFPGYVRKIEDWIAQASKLAASIGNPDLYVQDYYFTAGYDSPFRLFFRHNEIWFIAK